MFQGNLNTIAQMLLDVLLILVIGIFIIKDKVKRPISSREELKTLMLSLENFLKESKQISQEFSRNLDERKKTIKKLMSQLDDKVEEINLYLRNLEIYLKDMDGNSGLIQSGSNNPDVKNAIIALAKQSLDTSEIAERVGRSKDEVDLILDMKKQMTN